MKRHTSLEKEAKLFGTYLTGYPPAASHITLYQQSAPKEPASGTYAAALHHPFLLPCLDAHDALFRPTSTLRQRLYLMFSILEASPEHTELFLPQQRSRWYTATVFGYAIRSVYRLGVGTVIVRVRGW